MQISPEQLAEFKRLYREEFGEDISDAEALDSATSLLTLIKAVYKPIPKADFDRLNTPSTSDEPK